ncbi:MAG: PQQ-binding-like beta-propeller repeat protein [Planctomycetota bacterium]
MRLWLVVAGVLAFAGRAEAVVPIMIGPLQAFLAMLPGILLALGGFLITLFTPRTVKKLFLFLWHQKIFTVCLILLVSGLVYASRNDWWMPKGEVREAEAGTDWPAFRGGPQRRGFVPGSEDPDKPGAVWQYSDEKYFLSTPTVVGNRVYATFADYGPFRNRGGILCIDADTGSEVWRYDDRGYRATFASPSVKGDYIVCGEGLHLTRDARVFCLNAAGKLRWVYRTKSHVESTPCIADGKAYIGAGDDGYYCFALDGEQKEQPEPVWHLSAEQGFEDSETSPVVVDGVLYFGLGLGGKAVCAADAESGKLLWRIDTPYPVFSPPAVHNGKVYVGMGYGDYVNSAEQSKADLQNRMEKRGEPQEEIERLTADIRPGGEVWCIDAEKQEVAWKYGDDPDELLSRVVLGGVAVKDDRLYFGSRDGHLYCLSDRGVLVGRWNARAAVTSTPAVANEHVYFCTGQGVLYCLTADTLEPVWEARLGAGQLFSSSPTVARGHVFVGTPRDGLRCVGRVGEPPPMLWDRGERGGPADPSPLPERGRTAWRLPDDQEAARDVKLTPTAPMLSLGKAVYLPCTVRGKPELLKLRAKYGKPRDRGRELTDADRVVWRVQLDHPIEQPPVGVGKTIYAATREALLCVDAESGKITRTVAIEPGGSGRLTFDRGHLVLWSGPDTVTCCSLGSPQQPTELWTARVGPGGRQPPALAGDLCFVATDRRLMALGMKSGTRLWLKPPTLPGPPKFGPVLAGATVVLLTNDRLVAYNATDGSVRWDRALDAPPTQRPIPLRNRVIVATETAIAAYGALDGEPAWKAEVGACRAPLVLDKKKQMLVGVTQADPETKAGALVVIDTVLGKVERRLAETRRGLPLADGTVPPLVASGRVVFVGSKRGMQGNLMVLPGFESDRAERWASTGYLGKVLTPLLLLDSRVYFCTDERGAICTRLRTR